MNRLSSSWQFLLLYAAICLFVGFGAGLLAQQGINLNNNLTVDGLIAAMFAALAVLAATVIVPLWIQPKLYKYREINKALLSDVVLLLGHIEDLLEEYEEIHGNELPITIKQRQSVLSKHKKINNLARVISLQKDKSLILKSFDNDIFKPITDAKSSFSDDALPGAVFDDALFLSVRSALDPITYRLQELRYKLF